MKIVVASKNPVKIQAVQEGVASFFQEVVVEGVKVDSGVSDQPSSDEETFKGAQMRAFNARELCPGADFWIGVEGGIDYFQGDMQAFAWIYVSDGTRSGQARTTTFSLPPRIVELLEQGLELGAANDILFRQNNSKQKMGAVGTLTSGLISRKQLYVQAVQLAMVPFINPQLYA